MASRNLKSFCLSQAVVNPEGEDPYRAAFERLTRNETHRVAVNTAKLPCLLDGSCL
jgi:hypothetical protein